MASAARVIDDMAAKPLVKSRLRIAKHAEVLTPAWLVDDMLDLVKAESERIDSRFLEPACGTGNFLVRVLYRKLTTVIRRYGRSDFEKRHYAMLALMSVYGIEVQQDNVAECRANLLAVFSSYMRCKEGDPWLSAAANVLEANIVHGDALTMRAFVPGSDVRTTRLRFAEWSYLGRGQFQRRDFLHAVVATRSLLTMGDADHASFTPDAEYGPMTVAQIAGLEG
jgi:hypothetical protein